ELRRAARAAAPGARLRPAAADVTRADRPGAAVGDRRRDGGRARRRLRRRMVAARRPAAAHEPSPSPAGGRAALACAVMARFAVVGHVEWIEFALVSHVPVAGEIIDARSGFQEAAGSAAVVAVQLAKLAGGVDFFTALGDDERGRRSAERLTELGVTIHA